MYLHFLLYVFCGIFPTLLVASEGSTQPSRVCVTLCETRGNNKLCADLCVLSNKTQADYFYEKASHYPPYSNLKRSDIDNRIASFTPSSINQDQEKLTIQACYKGTENNFVGVSVLVEIDKRDVVQLISATKQQDNGNNLLLGFAFKNREYSLTMPVFGMQLSQDNVQSISDNSKPIEKETPVIVNTTASTNVQSYNVMGISILCLAALLYFFSLKKLTVPNPLG